MEKICVYTCITGDYDELRDVNFKEDNVDYICFTNNKKVKSNTWKIVYIEDNTLDNQRLSRKIKMLGHPIIDNNYEISVWQDASVFFQKKVSLFVKTYLRDNSFAAFVHHCRDCIYEEAMECIKRKKDTKEKILEQLAFLQKEKFPKHYGLFEMTVFIKKHNDPLVRKTMKMWFEMLCKYSKRDQLSFMYCIFKTNLKVSPINLNVWDNEWFKCYSHTVKDKLDTCRIYFGNDKDFNPEFDFQSSYKVSNGIYSVKGKVLTNTKTIEILISDIPCIEYSNFSIIGIKPNNICYYNSIEINNKNIFYNDLGIIKLEGEFIEGEIFEFSIRLQKLSYEEVYKIVEFLSVDNIKNRNYKKLYEETLIEFNKAKSELNSIINSKSWVITKPLRKLSSIKSVLKK